MWQIFYKKNNPMKMCDGVTSARLTVERKRVVNVTETLSRTFTVTELNNH